jgi:hypothetical protein
MQLYRVPADLHSRPELAPLVKLGCEPGEFILRRSDRDWFITLSPRVGASQVLALNSLTPVCEVESLPLGALDRPPAIHHEPGRSGDLLRASSE